MADTLSPAEPHPRAWMRTVLLPSLSLHPDRVADLPAAAAAWLARQQPGSAAWRRLHRHWSAQCLRTLAPLEGRAPDGIAAPLALLPPTAWKRLQGAAGAGLAAPHLRRVIAREAVALLRRQWGAPAHAWALAQPGAWLVEEPLPEGDLPQTCERWGAALVWRALDDAPPAWAQRLRLRLPPVAAQDAEAPPASRLMPVQAARMLGELLPLVEAAA